SIICSGQADIALFKRFCALHGIFKFALGLGQILRLHGDSTGVETILPRLFIAMSGFAATVYGDNQTNKQKNSNSTIHLL
ncbi:hypothetical protein ACSTH0_23590, partial [Vibrio parahaemolyticus]